MSQYYCRRHFAFCCYCYKCPIYVPLLLKATFRSVILLGVDGINVHDITLLLQMSHICPIIIAGDILLGVDGINVRDMTLRAIADRTLGTLNNIILCNVFYIIFLVIKKFIIVLFIILIPLFIFHLFKTIINIYLIKFIFISFKKLNRHFLILNSKFIILIFPIIIIFIFNNYQKILKNQV